VTTGRLRSSDLRPTHNKRAFKTKATPGRHGAAARPATRRLARRMLCRYFSAFRSNLEPNRRASSTADYLDHGRDTAQHASDWPRQPNTTASHLGDPRRTSALPYPAPSSRICPGSFPASCSLCGNARGCL
jgi:hypothetical protein